MQLKESKSFIPDATAYNHITGSIQSANDQFQRQSMVDASVLFNNPNTTPYREMNALEISPGTVSPYEPVYDAHFLTHPAEIKASSKQLLYDGYDALQI